MSAPDYDDPKSKLQLRLRPMSGSEMILRWGSVFARTGAILCLGGFVGSFIPGVQSDGNPLLFLMGAAVLVGGWGVFHVGHKLVRRLR
jgi:hypothetical protein